MEFLEKVVQNERTGANITGIQVDTSTQHLLNKPFLRGFEELEKIAKEMDAIKIKNKRTEFELSLEQMDLDFAEKWNDPNIYRDKEKYEAMLEDRKALQSEKAKLLSSNMYYNREEKINLKKELENKNKEIILGYQKNRNIEYLKETINSTNANIDQIIAIGQKNISPTDYESISKYVKKISVNLSYLQQPLGLTDKELENMIGARSKTLINGIYQEHLNKIISDPNMSIDKQEIELKKLAYSMDNKEYKEKLATDLANEFAKEDVEQTKNFFLTSFDSETKTIINQYRARFNEIKRARAKEEKAMQKFLKQQAEITAIKNEKKYEDDLFKRDALAVASYLDNKKGYRNLSLNEFLSNPVHMQRVTDIGWETYGDTNSGETLNIIPESLVKDLKTSIDNKINSGQFTRREAYQEVYDVADTLSNGNEAIRNNILKDMGLKLRVDPSIIINGEKNSKYYNLSNSISQANNFIDEMGYSLSDLKKTKENKKFKEISQTFSSDRELGDQLAFRYLVGEELKKTNKKDLAQDLDRTLSISLRKNGYNKENVQITSEFTSKRKNYRYSKLKDVREKKNQKEKVERKIKSDVLSQATVLGG
jgi:hypothetical protein